MNNIEKLKAVEITLNDIPVSGESNLDGMLGCIRAVRQVRMDLAKEEAQKDEPA